MARVDLHDVSVTYPVYECQSRSLKSAVIRKVGGPIFGKDDRVEIGALRKVNVKISDGERVALVGRNGAGKSTLLRVIAGIYEPCSGSVSREGSVSTLTDVTMGMDLHATGRENIRLRCIFLGMTYKEAAQRAEEIEKFCDLGAYLDLPARVYSTGMLVRLGFAASTSLRHDILVMDELIGAGDISFAKKAADRVSGYVDNARILVLASHNTDILRSFCTRAILLDGGSVIADGDVQGVLAQYERISSK